MERNNSEIRVLPAVALRGMVIFPGAFTHFDVGREKSVRAVQKAMETDQYLFLVAQKNEAENDPAADGLYEIGTIAVVKHLLKMPGSNGVVRVAVEGISRARMIDCKCDGAFLSAMVFPIKTSAVRADKQDYIKALVRHCKDTFAEYVDVAPQMPADIIETVMQENAPGRLADFVASNIMLDAADKQTILATINPIRRLEQMNLLLTEETRLLAIEEEINEKVQDQIDDNQREYYLREQMKIISQELGGGQDEAAEFREKIEALQAGDEIKEKLRKECDRFEKYAAQSPEAAVSRNYLEACLSLPWGVYSKETKDIKRSRKILEEDHYGLEKIKTRILESIAVQILAPQVQGQILCLVGPPGVGKTSIAKSVARATGRKYVRISLGGVRDEAEIRGHRKTYIGSMPGRIIEALQQAGTSNPLILLDEVDKLSSDYKGDPTSALLEVLDPAQNFSFRDHYIELPFDLSRVLFLTTANVMANIPEPLRDRMEIIELGSYTAEEKFHIAREHLIPKQLKQHGLNGRKLRITDEAIHAVIEGYTREAGVRRLEQQIAALCRKASMRFADGFTGRITVRPADLEALLGAQKFKREPITGENEIGVVNGLAWTSVGGDMLEVEAAVLDGTGKLELTGSLGEVMQESAKAAVSFLRAVAAEQGIDPTFYKNKDIHIHVPEGATPKDGPSAGVTIATALCSALSGRRVRKDVAMTGEITLRGRVLPIGGLKEKSMAAYKAGIRTVVIPAENAPDLDEVDPKVKQAVAFVPVKTVGEVWAQALEPLPVKQEPERKRTIPAAEPPARRGARQS